MRLNLDRIQRTAENEPQEALNDSGENSCLTPFKRPNSGHRGYLFLSCLACNARYSDLLHLIARVWIGRPVVGYRWTRGDDRDVSHPVSEERAVE